ncbi:phosphopantothenate-cysteine ligase, partial [Phakopsora pachyrhizi]
FSSQEYFNTQSPPSKLDETIDRVRRFVDHHVKARRRIVLITSGGTTVPLEHNVVRFLDNFSAGTRGSASAEYFLRTNRYAVIFLHRSHSLQPFLRHYSHQTHPFLNLISFRSQQSHSINSQLDSSPSDDPLFPILSSSSNQLVHQIDNSDGSVDSPEEQVVISEDQLESLKAISKAYHLVQSMNLILSIPFITVNEYLFYLRSIAKVLGEPDLGLGRCALLYLAAAVSDFFIPQQRLFEHKIQSGKGSLVIEMDAVPKVLKDVSQEWSNQAFVVSFKLETDPSLLIPKSRTALDRYGHQLVIANELSTRKVKCLMIDKSGTIESVEINAENPNVNLDGHDHEIEEDLVKRLIAKHDLWIDAHQDCS